MLGRSLQQQQESGSYNSNTNNASSFHHQQFNNQPPQETIFSSNMHNSQLVSQYFYQMSDQCRSLKTSKGTKHHKLLSGNILGQNMIPFQSKEVTDFELKSEKQKQDRIAIMERSFFIFELSSNDELDTDDDRMSEKTRYFYTHNCSCHPNDQLFIVGMIQAYWTFLSFFEPADEFVSVIQFLNSQLAVSKFNNNRNLLVVGAPISVPQSSLIAFAERMVNNMSMFHGLPYPKSKEERRQSLLSSTENFDKKSNHEENETQQKEEKTSPADVSTELMHQERMKDYGLELTALFDRFHESPVDMFHPLGYLELPPRNNAAFLSTVHLLDDLLDFFVEGEKSSTPREDSMKDVHYLGSCVLYEDNILCNHLPEMFVKDAVLFRLMCINEFISRSGVKGTNTNNLEPNKRSDWAYVNNELDAKTTDITDDVSDCSDADIDEDKTAFNQHSMYDVNERLDITRIYPNRELLQTLRENSDKLRSESSVSYYQSQMPHEEEDAQTSRDSRKKNNVEDKTQVVGLFTYKCGSISLVSVFEIRDVDRLMSIQKTLIKHIRSQCCQTLHRIDKQLDRLQIPKSFKVPTVSQSQNIGSPTADAFNRTESDNQPYLVSDRMRVKRPKAVSQQNIRRNMSEGNRSSVLMFNNNDQMLTTNNTSENFIHRCASAHEMMSLGGDKISTDKSMSQITKLYLKSASHILYSKKMFDTELIYHHQVQQPPSANQGKVFEQFKLEHLENQVRETVRREYHTHML